MSKDNVPSELNLEKDILAIVEQVFSKKEEASQKQAMQDALTESATTIESLTTELETLQSEFEAAKNVSDEELVTKETKISDLTTELEAAQKKSEELETELASVKEEIDNMKKDKVAEARMNELEEAKVIFSTDVEKQFAKVREMSDEDFESYKTERVELRAAVAKELAEQQEEAQETQATTENETEEASEETVGTEEASNDDDAVVTPPPNVGPGQAMAAAMNFETRPSDDMVKKYAELGNAMAAAFKAKSADK